MGLGAIARFASVGHFQNQDHGDLILQLGDYPIISHTEPPQALIVACQLLAMLARVLGSLDALVEETDDAFLLGRVQFWKDFSAVSATL